MHEILKAVGTAGRRLFLTDLLRNIAIGTTVGLGGVILTRLVQQTFGLALPWTAPYGGLFAGIGAAVLVGSVAWTIYRRPKTDQVARELDERAGLRESLSTALCVAKTEDAWAKVVVESAREKAARVNVREAVPIEPPRFWPVPVLTTLGLVLMWFVLPPFDVLGLLKKKEEKAAAQRQIEQVKADIKTNDEKLKKLLEKANVDVKADKDKTVAEEKPAEQARPEDIQRAAVKKLTDMADRVREAQQGEKGQQGEALREAMRQLRNPGPGPLDDMQRQMARGNFDKAQEALNELAKQLSDNSMSQEQRAQLQAQLQNMSKQLEKLAQDKKDVEKKLEAAGMDPKKAKELLEKMKSDPAAMKQALEQMKNLSEEQKKKLMEAAQAACKSGQQCENMSAAMAQMAKGMSKEGMNQEGQQGMQAMGEQLSEAEMLQGEMDSLNAAMSEIEGQLADLGECLGRCDADGMQDGPANRGEWRMGESNRRGNGSGGPGQGNYGGPTPDNPADYTTKKEKAKVKNAGGPIIGSRLVYGDQVRGESVAEFASAVDAAEKTAAESINHQEIRRELQESVKQYFSTLTAKAKENQKAKDGTSTPPPPSKDAKDAGKP